MSLFWDLAHKIEITWNLWVLEVIRLSETVNCVTVSVIVTISRFNYDALVVFAWRQWCELVGRQRRWQHAVWHLRGRSHVGLHRVRDGEERLDIFFAFCVLFCALFASELACQFTDYNVARKTFVERRRDSRLRPEQTLHFCTSAFLQFWADTWKPYSLGRFTAPKSILSYWTSHVVDSRLLSVKQRWQSVSSSRERLPL